MIKRHLNYENMIDIVSWFINTVLSDFVEIKQHNYWIKEKSITYIDVVYKNGID